MYCPLKENVVRKPEDSTGNRTRDPRIEGRNARQTTTEKKPNTFVYSKLH